MHLPRPSWRSRATWTAVSLSSAAALLFSPLPALADDARPVEGPKVDAALAGAVEDGGEAAFFVVLDDQADLSAARGEKSHGARAKAAYGALREHARDNQRSLTAFLDKEKVGHQDFWIADVVRVEGDAELVAKLAARSDVAGLVKERRYELDEIEQAGPADTVAAAEDAAPEWGIADVKADQVWEQYDNRGEGIVIANVDSGVQFDHPDLVANYRGNKGDGTFAHDYNWYDPSGQCPTSGVPCDNNGHGTHTMGTMVGANGIGVAPGAKWIAAKGCESSSCSDTSLLAAGQWILAPTDSNGLNPKPELAPNIVNNSWGGGHTTFYQDIVEAWNAAGIFEAFAAGNKGNGTTCSTSEAPGSQAPSYGVGAYDSSGKIANFSGFGPSRVDGSMKPNIAAPGVDIRSTWPGSAYNTINGTSMATPHVAGATALLWSSAPSLIGDIDATRAFLNQGARNVDDTHCGGTAEANNVWGEGKLDILASVDKAPHTAVTVSGKVTDKATGAALPGIDVKVTGATTGTRIVSTGSDGSYRVPMDPGTYDFALSGYGYAPKQLTGVELTAGQPLVQDIALDAVASHSVTGTVLDVTGKPLAKATVEVTGIPVDAVRTGTDGTFTLPKVAEGAYTLTVTPTEPVLCNGIARTPLTVDGAETRTVRLPARTDRYGNSCTPATYSWIKGATAVPLSGDEDAKTLQLPFPVRLYGVEYSSASVTTNGLVNFLQPRLGDYINTALPAAEEPNGIVAPFWDDLTLDRRSSVQTATTGKAGGRKFAVVWNQALLVSDNSRVTFEAVFDEATGDVTFQYQSVPGAGSGATVGIEDQSGTDALQYSFEQAVLGNGSAIRIMQGAK
ncbi:S8 family serine peptidase [Streptomyces sp. YC504]|uniref:S8 family serine peptidase n=1 Tax=Streptomyces mesophilus TaxID=1775132 RepID=A0A6G4XJQ7_9ACTN|nr:S8 family serine peptidase [Streptomyces mesophilus]NGO77806.1 S8 family serine peptidase [Streptomyces mesophilus]